MSRFNIPKALKGDPISFISVKDSAIDWPNSVDGANEPITPERYQEDRDTWSKFLVARDGMEFCEFTIHAHTERELQLAMLAAGVEPAKEGPRMAGVEQSNFSKNLGIAEVSFQLGRICVDGCEVEPDLIQLESWRRVKRVKLSCIEEHPELEDIFAEIGIYLLTKNQESAPNS